MNLSARSQMRGTDARILDFFKHVRLAVDAIEQMMLQANRSASAEPNSEIFDDGKLIETKWTPSTNGRSAFAPSAIPFIRALSDNGKLFLRAIGYGGNSYDGDFRLAKVSEVREKLSIACNWPRAR